VVADHKDRISRVVKEQNIGETKAEELITGKDKAASSFIYDFFDADWNDPHNYHLVINSSLIKPDDCINLILKLLKRE
jgi:cytidylate kinase